MPFWIMKSGLEIFDVTRAYGLAALLSYADEDQSTSPVISDAGAAYCVDFPEGKPSAARLTDANNSGWLEAFATDNFGDLLSPQWNNVFLTTRERQENKRSGKVSHPRKAKIGKVKATLERKASELSQAIEQEIFTAEIGKGELLPGPLDPSAFKGLKHRTRSDYKEDETAVDVVSWALACLGGALAGRFVYQRDAGYFVTYPVPESVQWTGFREVRKETYGERLSYLSVQNAAAHYSVILADHLRARAASGLVSAPRYTNLLYFSLFKTGNQWKPGNAGRLNLQPLLELSLGRPHAAEGVFKVWQYLFRRGSLRGNEDLALAITDLVMRPALDSYERHVRVFARYIAEGTKAEFQYSDQSLKEVTALVSSH